MNGSNRNIGRKTLLILFGFGIISLSDLPGSFPWPCADNVAFPAVVGTEEKARSLSPDEFATHYCEILLIRYTHWQEPAGYTEALQEYFTGESLSPNDLKTFASAHEGDLSFWKELWAEIEECLKGHLTVTDGPE